MPADDIEAIRQLKARYFRTMDTKDWDGMRQVFTDGVVIDTSEAGGSLVTGADEFMIFLQEALGGAVSLMANAARSAALSSAAQAAAEAPLR